MLKSIALALTIATLAVTTACSAEDITVFADFEHGLGDWTTGGEAFGVSPRAGDRWGRFSEGEFFADSLAKAEHLTGVLRSPQFTCPDEVRFVTNGWDLRDGSGGRNFYRLLLGDGTIIAQSTPPLTTGGFREMRWRVTRWKGQPVRIEVVDGAADGSFAWLAIDHVRLVDLGPLVPADQTDLYAVRATDATPIEAAGLAFSPWPSPPDYTNGQYEIALGCRASELFLLGHVSTHDHGCAPWPEHNDFTRDFTRQQMIGDEIGKLRIEYADGSATEVPLIFGFTAWWDGPWRENQEPIRSNPEARAAFEASCHLRQVTLDDGALRFVSAIACEDKPITRVVLVDSPTKAGCPAFWGLSVRAKQPSPEMTPLPHHAYDDRWLSAHRISGRMLDDEAFRGPLAALKSRIGMSDVDLPTSVARNVPRGFRGPRFTLTGSVLADILTNAYSHTTHSAATASIREDGYIYCAPPNMPDYNAYDSIGTYQVISRGATSSWTRGYEYLRDLAAWGYVDVVTRAIDWADSKLWYYEKDCPARFTWQGEQRPWPAHWATMADHPPADTDPGQNEIPGDENDGHALTMMMRYSAWLSTGKDPAWLRQRWEPAIAAAEWLCFVLDYTGQDVLYCESEGTCYGLGFDRDAENPYDTYPHYDIFTNVLGCLALRQYAEMARSLGEPERAARWDGYAQRIETDLMRKCVDHDPTYGDVWRVHPNSIWPQFDERLTPVFELPYWLGLDAAKLPAEVLRISRNSLRMQIGNPPDYHHGLGLGYGQGWIAAAALLLDEMQTARPLLDNLARYMYFPKHPHPFTGIEGIVVNEDGDFRVRNGSIGIDEGLFVTRVFRVMMGIDDTDPAQTVLMPRLPEGYDSIRVADHPVLTGDPARPTVTRLSYTLRKRAEGMELTVSARDPLRSLRARLGPFEAPVQGATLTVNGQEQPTEWTRSGDSWWAWAELGKGVGRGRITIEP